MLSRCTLLFYQIKSFLRAKCTMLKNIHDISMSFKHKQTTKTSAVRKSHLDNLLLSNKPFSLGIIKAYV